MGRKRTLILLALLGVLVAALPTAYTYWEGNHHVAPVYRAYQ